MLGVACGLLAPRRAGLLVALVFVASLAAALLPLLHGPQVFAFHHLGGMYPGPIYDEDIRPSAALYWFRLDTLLYAAACAGAALLVKGRRRGLLLLLAAGAPAVLLSFQAEKLHWKASLAQVDAELGGRLETEHLVLHFPREKPEPEQRLLALDAEASVRGVSQFLGAPPGARISVFLYRSADEKRRLVGAADTSFTKPWLRQIHTNDAPAPHPILRHELVHALAADLARGPFGVPGRLFGLLPEMALIEGLAVAGDWPPGEFTAHEETRALRELKLMPEITRLFAPGLFYAESGARAYTSAGSFVRFLWETRGPAWLRDVYAGRAQLGLLAPLALEYEKFLDGQRAPERAVALASLRFSAKAIVRKRCAHEVAGLQREAGLAGLRGDAAGAVSLWARGCALEPDDPGLLLQLRRAQASAHQDEAARATLAQLLAHPKLARPLRAQALTEAGDGAWKAGDAGEAAARFEADHRVLGRDPGFACDERTDRTAGDVAGERLVIVIGVRHDGRAAREREQLAAQTEDRARGHRVFQAARFTDLEHVGHHRAATAERLDHGTGVFFLHVDDDVFDRLQLHAILFHDDDLGLGNADFEAFATHRFD